MRAARARHVALLAASVVAQVYACIYWGWFLGFLFALALLAALALPAARPLLLAVLKQRWPALALAAAASGLVLVPLALPYLHAAHAVGYRGYGEATGMLPRIQSWFFMGERSWLYGRLAQVMPWSGLPQQWEHVLGIGFVTLGVALASFWRERARPAYQVLAVTALAAIVLTMWFRGHWSPWWLVFHTLPGAAALRAVSRSSASSSALSSRRIWIARGSHSSVCAPPTTKVPTRSDVMPQNVQNSAG